MWFRSGDLQVAIGISSWQRRVSRVARAYRLASGELKLAPTTHKIGEFPDAGALQMG